MSNVRYASACGHYKIRVLDLLKDDKLKHIGHYCVRHLTSTKIVSTNVVAADSKQYWQNA